MFFHHVDFGQLPVLPPVDDLYIALGSTIKVAGSQAAFRAIDHDAVLALARQAHQAGAQRLAVVSAMGADAGSRIFYNRIKGETENALRALGFDTLVIARPSMLDGDRAALDQAGRLGEKIGLALMRRISALIPANYRAIAARDVAHAMVQSMNSAAPGTHVLLSGQMQASH
ncbi:MAG: epimerase [Betaproteobacteria bacterium]